jgi:AcrR family transcriptional regulator
MPPQNLQPPADDLQQGSARERLLDAAERLFAAKGFQVGVREITLEAGCNVAGVNYYFGGKEGLYRLVFRRRLAALRERRIASVRRILGEAGEGATLELLLRTFTTGFLEPLVEESTGRLWMELMSRELLDPHLPPDMFREEIVDPVRDALVEGLCQVCPGLGRQEAELATHSLIGQLTHIVHMTNYSAYSAREECARTPFRFDLPQLVNHTVRFSAAGIRALARPAERA